MKVAYAGGGSGGHITPVLSVARAMGTLDPTATAFFFVTDEGLERGVVERAGHPRERVAAARVARRSYLRFPFVLLRGILQAREALLRRRPDVVVGGGGFVTVPVLLAARLCGIPSVLLEQNTVPGRSNRLLSRVARFVVTAFPETEGFAEGVVTRCLGNPLRFCREDFSRGRSRGFHLLATGGGQGARVINEALADGYEALLAGGVERITHVCGSLDRDRLAARAARHGERVDLQAYVDDMGPLLASADLVISRAGATTLAELAELGRPAVLVPIPNSVYDHQRKNAALFERRGGALTLEQGKLSAESLVSLVLALRGDSRRLEDMSAALDALRRPRAAEEIARVLLSEFSSGGPR